MQLAAIHRRVIMDARVLQEALADVLPVKLPKRYQGRAFNLSSFLARLNAVTEQYGIYNAISMEPEDARIPPNTVLLTGTWLPEDLLPQQGSSADIRLEWHVAPNHRRQRWTQKEWAKRRFYFWSYAMHEMIHRHQDVYRGDGSLARVYRPWAVKEDAQDEQKYLGDYDEIEAHAHAVAREMRTWSPDHTYREGIQQMKSDVLPAPFTSTYSVYMRAFRDAKQHPALPVFHRKIKQWWQLMGEQDEFYHFLHLESSWL
jgi:hypothetical protein